MIEKILIFMIFLCPLVFFHELGHFIFARLFKVKVEVFSIGFGPKLFKKKFKDTEYAFSLIPLGGYVKMFGDDPLSKDSIPEELRSVSFTFKNKWARFWIVMGGPLANFILAFFIFFLLVMIGEKVPEIKIGPVYPGLVLYDLGLRSGDIVKKINNKEVIGPTDINESDDSNINSIKIVRKDREIDLSVQVQIKKFYEEFLNSIPNLRKAYVVDKSGKRFVISKFQDKFDHDETLEQMGEMGDLTFYILPIDDKEKILDKGQGPFKISFADHRDFLKYLIQAGFYPIDLVVKTVNMKSAADKAGIKGLDIITQINEVKVTSFDELKSNLQKSKNEAVVVSLLRKGQELKIEVRPEITKMEGKEVKLIGVLSSGEFQEYKMVQMPSRGPIDSLIIAAERTYDTTVKTFIGFKKLITNEVSLKNIGGPLAIGKVAADSFNTSLSYFFQVMALISVNLGVINLFPIPVLDGGHIMFIGLELVNRGPLSQRKMEIAQQFGLSLLLILTFAALYNDFTRFFNL